jgi:hypothetical protein
MDINEVNAIVENENRSKQWDCAFMFEVFGLEGKNDILQYVKPNPLSSALETLFKCQENHYPPHCMMRFPEVYSSEENWEFGLKVAHTKSAEERGVCFASDKELQAHSPRETQCHREEGRWHLVEQNFDNVLNTTDREGIFVARLKLGYAHSQTTARQRMNTSHRIGY